MKLGWIFVYIGASAAVCAVAPSAWADAITAGPEQNDPTLRPISPERRNGLVLGASGGIALAGASGYPNDAKFHGDPTYYSSSPLMVGYSTTFFLMGALSDYVSFGPMVSIATFETERWRSTGWGMGFRGEVFPFVKVFPVLADTAFFAQLGFGETELRAKGPYPSADGAQSFFGAGIHHEWRLGRLLGGHGALGPYLEYDTTRAPSAERHWLTAGVRVVWYGGGVKLDR